MSSKDKTMILTHLQDDNSDTRPKGDNVIDGYLPEVSFDDTGPNKMTPLSANCP